MLLAINLGKLEPIQMIYKPTVQAEFTPGRTGRDHFGMKDSEGTVTACNDISGKRYFQKGP